MKKKSNALFFDFFPTLILWNLVMKDLWRIMNDFQPTPVKVSFQFACTCHA